MDRPPWTVRRRLVIATLMFCAFCITWIMIRGDSRPVNEVIVMCSFGLAFSVLGSYIFGAVWDDKNVMSLLGPQAYGGKAKQKPEPSTDNEQG